MALHSVCREWTLCAVKSYEVNLHSVLMTQAECTHTEKKKTNVVIGHCAGKKVNFALIFHQWGAFARKRPG